MHTPSSFMVRAVYCIESIGSYRYHKANASITIEMTDNTLKKKLFIILISIELFWHKVNDFLIYIKIHLLCSFNDIILKIMSPEQYAKRPKGKISTVLMHFIPKSEKKCTLSNTLPFSFQSLYRLNIWPFSKCLNRYHVIWFLTLYNPIHGWWKT